MALLFMEGFEGYGAVGDAVNLDAMLTRYSRVDLTSDPSTGTTIQAGTIGGKCLRVFGSANNNFWISQVLGSDSTFICGFRFRFDALPTATQKLLFIYDASGTEKATLQISTGGVLSFVSTIGGTGITGTGATLSINTWYWIEFKVKFATGTGGDYTLKVDGSSAQTQSGINTVGFGNSVWSSFGVDSPVLSTSAKYYWFDDFYVADSTGSDNNTMLGDVRVIGLFPDADAGTNQFMPSSGTDHYAVVNEANPSNSTYLDGASGDVELFTHADLTEGGGIFGVSHRVQIEKTEPVAPDAKLKCVSGATTSNGTTEKLSASPYVMERIHELNPDGSSAWTRTTLNAAKFGVEAV